MIVIPAIDIKDGQCVRLKQGDLDATTVFSDHPAKMAARWVDAGARRLHIVDLNGAVEGRPVNGDVVEEIVREFPTLDVQIGGGIRDIETASFYIDRGVRYVIAGTMAVQHPERISALCRLHPDHVIVGLDARDGSVATDGWVKVSGIDVRELAAVFTDAGVSAIVYTDIARDGMLAGANVAATFELAEVTEIPVIASGGVRDLDDIRALSQTPAGNTPLFGVIVGRSIYEGTLDLGAAQSLADDLAREALGR